MYAQMSISYVNAYLHASAYICRRTHISITSLQKILVDTTKFPKMHVCARARHYYITFSFGLNVFIKNFSFSFRLTVLFLFSLKNGNIKYFGFSLEHLSICPVSGIILFELSRICWLWTITRFLKLFVSPMYNALHPRHSITYTTFFALQVMGALTLNILPFLKSNSVPSIKCEHNPQLDLPHFVTEFSQLSFKLNFAFVKILLRFCGCLLLLIICLSPSALFIVSLRNKIGRFFLISVKNSGLYGLNVETLGTF